MSAVLLGKKRSVQYLLKRGADPTVGAVDGYTPMHAAAYKGRTEIAQMLIANGLDPWDTHTDGHLPMTRVRTAHSGTRVHALHGLCLDVFWRGRRAGGCTGGTRRR